MNLETTALWIRSRPPLINGIWNKGTGPSSVCFFTLTTYTVIPSPARLTLGAGLCMHCRPLNDVFMGWPGGRPHMTSSLKRPIGPFYDLFMR